MTINSILDMPNEIMINILKFIEVKNYNKITQVCKRWNELIQTDILWKIKCEQIQLSISPNLNPLTLFKTFKLKQDNLFAPLSQIPSFSSEFTVSTAFSQFERIYNNCAKLISNNQLFFFRDQKIYNIPLNQLNQTNIPLENYLFLDLSTGNIDYTISKLWIIDNSLIVNLKQSSLFHSPGSHRLLKICCDPQNEKYKQLLGVIDKSFPYLKVLHFKDDQNRDRSEIITLDIQSKHIILINPTDDLTVRKIDCTNYFNLIFNEDETTINVEAFKELHFQMGGHNQLLLQHTKKEMTPRGISYLHQFKPTKNILFQYDLQTLTETDLNPDIETKTCLSLNYRASISLINTSGKVPTLELNCIDLRTNNSLTKTIAWPHILDNTNLNIEDDTKLRYFISPFYNSVLKCVNKSRDEFIFTLAITNLQQDIDEDSPCVKLKNEKGTYIFLIKIINDEILLKDCNFLKREFLNITPFPPKINGLYKDSSNLIISTINEQKPNAVPVHAIDLRTGKRNLIVSLQNITAPQKFSYNSGILIAACQNSTILTVFHKNFNLIPPNTAPTTNTNNNRNVNNNNNNNNNRNDDNPKFSKIQRRLDFG